LVQDCSELTSSIAGISGSIGVDRNVSNGGVDLVLRDVRDKKVLGNDAANGIVGDVAGVACRSRVTDLVYVSRPDH